MSLHRLVLAYDGTDYSGWQVQPGKRTIQGALQDALARLAKHPVKVTGAGRTDAGVHARAQVAHFRLNLDIPLEGIQRGLNSILPPDVRVRSVTNAPPDFHARYSARSKTYRYFIDRSSVASPFRSRFSYHYPYPLDEESMARAAASFVGRVDFAAFRAASCVAKSTVRDCTVSRFLEVDGELVYEVAASGFLQYMARNLVGTLLLVGRRKLAPESIPELLLARDRRRCGPTAKPRGLHLMRVDYPAISL